MKKFKFYPPYRSDGKTTFPHTQQKSGVYLIREGTKLVYIGYSAVNLYKTMYRHFQRWNHRSQEVVSYESRMSRNKYTVRVVLCTPIQAARLERALIKKHKPRDNENKYDQYKITAIDENAVKSYESAEVWPDPPF